MSEYKRFTIKNWRESKHTKAYEYLAELEDKIENGTLIELPCKVGDTVYEAIQGMPIQEWEITSIYWGKTYGKNYVMLAERKRDLANWRFWKEDFGEKLFLTKAEAEAKLRELKDGRRNSKNA